MFDSTLESAQAAGDTAAIRGLIATAHGAWAAGDGRTYAGCFTEPCRGAAFFGLCRDGRAANAELHGALFNAAAAGGALGGEIDAIEWLSADVALARTASNGRAPGYQTYLLVRLAGAWRIRSFQHTAASKVALWAAQRVRRGAG